MSPHSLPTSHSRRGFMSRAALLAGAGLVAPSLALARQRKESPVPKVIDSHQHLWNLKQFRLPWTDNDKLMARDFGMRDYLAATSGIPIEKSVYIEVDVEPSQQQAEADYVSQLCAEHDSPLAAAVISGRPASDGFGKYVRQFRDHKYIRGLRQVLHGPSTPAGYCLQPEFIAGIRQLGECGLSYDICIRAVELQDAARLIDACPDTFFILDHCGGANVQTTDRDTWRRDLSAIADRTNVVCKVSGIIASAKPEHWTVEDLEPIVTHTLDAFGPDRVLYGGDWPVCNLAASYRQWFDAVCQIVEDRPVAQKQALFYDNAARAYRLG